MAEIDFSCINKAIEIKTSYDNYYLSRPDKEMLRIIESTMPISFITGRILTLEKGKHLQIQIVPMRNGQRLWQSPAKVKSISIEKD